MTTSLRESLRRTLALEPRASLRPRLDPPRDPRRSRPSTRCRSRVRPKRGLAQRLEPIGARSLDKAGHRWLQRCPQMFQTCPHILNLRKACQLCVCVSWEPAQLQDVGRGDRPWPGRSCIRRKFARAWALQAQIGTMFRSSVAEFCRGDEFGGPDPAPGRDSQNRASSKITSFSSEPRAPISRRTFGCSHFGPGMDDPHPRYPKQRQLRRTRHARNTLTVLP